MGPGWAAHVHVQLVRAHPPPPWALHHLLLLVLVVLLAVMLVLLMNGMLLALHWCLPAQAMLMLPVALRCLIAWGMLLVMLQARAGRSSPSSAGNAWVSWVLAVHPSASCMLIRACPYWAYYLRHARSRGTSNHPS